MARVSGTRDLSRGGIVLIQHISSPTNILTKKYDKSGRNNYQPTNQNTMLYSNKSPKEIMSDTYFKREEDLIDQLDNIEDTIVFLREDVRDFRTSLDRFEELRSRVQGLTI
jgi:hypothetical protein